MSLLIDALRKAEADRKRNADVASSPETASEVEQALQLEPIDLDNADLPVAEPRPQSERPHQTPAATTARKSASRREPARQPALPPVPTEPPSIVAWALGLGLLAAALGAAYVWWQIQPHGEGIAVTTLSSNHDTLPPPSPAVPPPQIPLAASSTLPNREAAADTAPTPPRPPAPRAHARPPAIEAARATAPDANANADSENPLPEIRRGQQRSANPAQAALEAGWAAYQRGQLGAAREQYQAALIRDPRSTEALNGLGAVALREGRKEEAQSWFERSRALDPGDAVALSGLSSLGRSGDSRGNESRLRGLLAEKPDTAPAHFALGLLMAQAGRWGEAQQAFFSAHSLQPENPDYLYNLAVALDQLNQTRLARGFYAQALERSATLPAAFDVTAARQRLAALSATAAP